MAHREKTKYTGVYYRTSSTKRYDGKPDVCFDIAYKLEGKLIWEKVGWRSEGYTAVLASEIRGERIGKETPSRAFPRTPDSGSDLSTGMGNFQGKNVSPP